MLIISCPHCNQSIEVIEINCRIFRCGILKSNFTQIHPHLPKSECDRLFNEQLIYGCGKPFKLVKPVNNDVPIGTNNDYPPDPTIKLDQSWTVEICDYE